MKFIYTNKSTESAWIYKLHEPKFEWLTIISEELRNLGPESINRTAGWYIIVLSPKVGCNQKFYGNTIITSESNAQLEDCLIILRIIQNNMMLESYILLFKKTGKA